jgi:TPP-dependent pyruvate/acetoin dehydrogenase alpha subunit
LLRHEARLAAEGILDEQRAARLKQQVAYEVAHAMAQAREDPMPDTGVLGLDRVFAGA